MGISVHAGPRCRSGNVLALRARGWPLGEAGVNIRLNLVDEVSIEEVVRNSEALRRLGDIAVHREKDS